MKRKIIVATKISLAGCVMVDRTMLKKIFFFMLILSLVATSAFGADKEFPEPVGAINDFANVLPAQQRQTLEIYCQDIYARTGVAIVVATFTNINDQPSEDFANRLYQAWGIGKKGEDNGLLILLAVKERKIRIETGYGVEGILPDGKIGEILDSFVLKHLRNDDYAQGISNAVISIGEIVAQNMNASSPVTNNTFHRKHTKGQSQLNPIALLMLVIVVLLLVATPQGRR
ncbi:MAG: TPM domain-containing protein, partial [Deltaproteobacteria bacterium]